MSMHVYFKQLNCMFDYLNDIYHSNDSNEMLIKADLYNIDLNDMQNIEFLIDTTAYHHAFWPHTAKRFVAFKDFLRNYSNLKIEDIGSLISYVNMKIDEIKNDKWKVSIPGGKQEMKNLQQVEKILLKLLEKQTSK